MKTAVAALLRMLNIVLPLNQRNVILFQKTVCQLINIAWKRTDHDIADIFLNRFQCDRDVFHADFPHNALIRFDPCFDSFDRVLVIGKRVFLIQHAELCLDFHNGALIIRHQKIERLFVLLHHLNKLIR